MATLVCMADLLQGSSEGGAWTGWMHEQARGGPQSVKKLPRRDGAAVRPACCAGGGSGGGLAAEALCCAGHHERLTSCTTRCNAA